MYLIPFALFFFGNGRSYYLAAAYPMLFAMGGVVGEQWVGKLRRKWSVAVQVSYFVGVALCGALFIGILVPVANRGPLKAFALKNSSDLREEIGWDELVKAVADVRDSLPPDQRATAGVITGNYGEQGAIEILGAAYHLPTPIGLTNSAWLRGYPTPQPTTLIVVGFSREAADRRFLGCRVAGHNGNSEGVKNEEAEYHPDIFLCDGPRLPWAEFWKKYQSFG